MPAIDVSKIGEGGGIFCRPAIHEDTAYFGACDKYFYAIDAKDGSELWKIFTDGAILSSPALDNKILYFGCFDNCLYAVSIKEKDIVWKLRTGGIIASSPIVKGNIIYFGSCDSYLYAVSAKTHETLWKFKTGNEIIGNPIIDNDKIYFGSTDKYFYCLDKKGVFVWKFLAGGEFLIGEPCISDNSVYAAASDGYLYALDKNTGELKWKFLSGEEAYLCNACDEKFVYFGSRDRYLYALDKNTGELKWKFRGNMSFNMPPIITKDRIYIGLDKIYAIDKKGHLIWQYNFSEIVDAFSFAYSPVLYKNKLYFTAFDGYFRCIDIDGNPLWEFRTNAPRGVEFKPGVMTSVSWWDEKQFSVFEEEHSFAPAEPYPILSRYGTDILTELEDKIENKYVDMKNPYLKDKKYAEPTSIYTEKKNTENTNKWKKVFGI